MKREIVYKVVRVEGDKRLSAVTNGVWQVEYKPGKVTRPRKRTKLLAFKSREAALDFTRFIAKIERDDVFEIWKCEARDCEAVYNLPGCGRANDFIDFWRKLSRCEFFSVRPRTKVCLFMAPPGTVACSALKLRVRVARYTNRKKSQTETAND